MLLFGAQLGVRMTQEHLTENQHNSVNPSPSSSVYNGHSCLVYNQEGCQPAYTRLRVTDHNALMAHHCVNHSCMLECDGHYWLSSHQLNMYLQDDYNKSLANPADQCTFDGGPAGQAQGGTADIVPTLVADKPHPIIKQYIDRLYNTEWPSQAQRHQIQQLPMNLVLVGHKDSPRKHQEFRLSCSTVELVLISALPTHIKQGYIAFKYVMKYFLKIYRGQNETGDGRSKIGSFYFKSTLLYHLEKTQLSNIISPFDLMMDLLSNFLGYLNHGKLPHYFFPECDLLATVGYDERQIAIKSINRILSDPIAAVLKCPAVPRQIYGDILPEELVDVFFGVSTHPHCEWRRDELILVLSRLDEWRHQVYHEVLVEDSKDGVSGRPKPRGLVRGILEKQTNISKEFIFTDNIFIS